MVLTPPPQHMTHNSLAPLKQLSFLASRIVTPLGDAVFSLGLLFKVGA
jgi:hypothetical protein